MGNDFYQHAIKRRIFCKEKAINESPLPAIQNLYRRGSEHQSLFDVICFCIEFLMQALLFIHLFIMQIGAKNF
jgi:hypothetical protein